MKRHKRGTFNGSYLLTGMLGMGLLFACLLAGLMAAVLPPGALLKITAIPIALCGLLLLWVMPKRNSAPDGALNLILLVLVALINIWPTYIIYRFGGLPSINPTKLAWLVFLLGGTLCMLSCKEPMERFVARCKAHPVIVSGIVSLMTWRVLSSMAGEEPISQVFGLGGELVSFYMVFFVALGVLRDKRDVFRLLAVLTVVGLLQAGLAGYESVVKHTLFARFITVSADDALTLQSVLMEKLREGRYRAQGTFEHPMVLAEFMAMMVPVAAAVFLTQKTVLLRWASMAFVPVAVAMIVASRSRSGIAVLLAALILVGILLLLPRGDNSKRQKADLMLLASVLLLPLVLLGGYFAAQEVFSLIAGRSQNEASSTMARVLMLERGIPLIASNPLFGYGNGLGVVKLGFFDGVRFNIDNYWLGLALDAGVPGLLAFLVSFISAILLGIQTYRRRTDSVGTAAGLIAISLVMLMGTKTVLSISSGFSLAYILIAAMIVLADAPAESTEEVVSLPQKGMRPVVRRGLFR